MYGIINYTTALGCILMIRQVIVKPKESALIKCIYHDNCYPEKHNIQLMGEEYARWGENDDYLGVVCLAKINPADKIADMEVNAISAAIPTATIDDNRSVHNEADIQRIQTLQQQLDEQAAKLKTITELLFKNGSL
jgi:hypothetical protein